MRCEGCGAQINPESKRCEYCKIVVNPDGKDMGDKPVECFIIEDVFTIVNRSVVVGKVLEPIKVGDFVYLGEKRFDIIGMQVGRNNVNDANAGDNCGLVFRCLSKKDLSRGDRLVLR